jgi:hypothetical protein
MHFMLIPVTLAYFGFAQSRDFLYFALYYCCRLCADHEVGSSCGAGGEAAAESELKTQAPKTFLVTGGKMGKTLHIARCLSERGHKVILAEKDYFAQSCGSKWSRAVTAFEPLPCSRTQEQEYSAALVAICKKWKVDCFLPVADPASALPDARAKGLLEAAGVKVLHFEEELCGILDDKHRFSKWCLENRLSCLESYSVCSDEEVRRLNAELLEAAASGAAAGGSSPPASYILKNLAYDPIHRLDLFQLPCADLDKLEAYLTKIQIDGNEITAEHPWQVQRFVTGTEHSACAVIRDGEIVAVTVCESSASQLNYYPIRHAGIESWMFGLGRALKRFWAGAGKQINGVLCLDFMVEGAADDVSAKVWPLECNPRVHTQCAVFARKEQMAALGAALACEKVEGELARLLGVGETQKNVPRFWFGNEMYKMMIGDISVPDFFKRLVYERDADLVYSDPYVFLWRNHVQIPALLWKTLVRGVAWKKCDYAIGKVVEINGD